MLCTDESARKGKNSIKVIYFEENIRFHLTLLFGTRSVWSSQSLISKDQCLCRWVSTGNIKEPGCRIDSYSRRQREEHGIYISCGAFEYDPGAATFILTHCFVIVVIRNTHMRRSSEVSISLSSTMQVPSTCSWSNISQGAPSRIWKASKQYSHKFSSLL